MHVAGKFTVTERGNLELKIPVCPFSCMFGVTYRISGARAHEALKLLMQTTVASRECSEFGDTYRVSFEVGHALNGVFGMTKWKSHASLLRFDGETAFVRDASVSCSEGDDDGQAFLTVAGPTTYTNMSSGLWAYTQSYTFLTHVPPQLLDLVATNAIEISMSASHTYIQMYACRSGARRLMPFLQTCTVFSGALLASDEALVFPMNYGAVVMLWVSCTRPLQSLVMEVQYSDDALVIDKRGSQLKGFRDENAGVAGFLVALNADDGSDAFSDACLMRKDVCTRATNVKIKLAFEALRDGSDTTTVTVHALLPNCLTYVEGYVGAAFELSS